MAWQHENQSFSHLEAFLARYAGKTQPVAALESSGLQVRIHNEWIHPPNAIRTFYFTEFIEGPKRCVMEFEREGLELPGDEEQLPNQLYSFRLVGTSKDYVARIWQTVVELTKPLNYESDAEGRRHLAGILGWN